MGAACSLPLQEAVMAARSRVLVAPRSNRGGAGVGRRRRKTSVRAMARRRRGSGDAGVQRRLRVGTKERLWLRRGWGGLGMLVTRARIPRITRVCCGSPKSKLGVSF
jgi:hypothetical protein